MPAHHTFSDMYKELTPGSVFVVYLALTFFLFVSKVLFKCCKSSRCLSFKKKIDKIQVEQRLASFFSSLKSSDRQSMIREEVQDQERLKAAKLSSEQLTELVLEEKAEKALRLKGYPSYRILRHKIATEFNYTPPGIQGQK